MHGILVLQLRSNNVMMQFSPKSSRELEGEGEAA